MRKSKYHQRHYKRHNFGTAVLVGVLLLLALLPVLTVAFGTPSDEAPSESTSMDKPTTVPVQIPTETPATEPTVEETEPSKSYTEEDVMMLARTIYYEAWCDCSDRHRELVAQVVLNRVASYRFPNTIYEVLSQKGQYAGDYYSGALEVPDFALEKCRELAIKALEGKVECPPNVVFQSNYPGLGDGIWMEFETFYSTTYFNYITDY